MPDRMAWSDLISEVVFWPFLRMRSKNMAQNPIKLRFEPKFRGTIYRFATMPDRMAWLDLKSEVVFEPLLRM